MSVELTREIRDKRIAVARDVIERLDLKKLRISRGCYIRGELWVVVDPTSDLQRYVDKVEANCQVCMLGAALLSKARLFDEAPIEPLLTLNYDRVFAWREDTTAMLSDIFDDATMDRMECAFEKSTELGGISANEALNDAVEFGRQFDNSSDRARAIAQNIIDNDGEFIIPAQP